MAFNLASRAFSTGPGMTFVSIFTSDLKYFTLMLLGITVPTLKDMGWQYLVYTPQNGAVSSIYCDYWCTQNGAR